MAKKTISTDQAPKVIGPYSQAILASAGEVLFLAGQIGLDPTTQEMVKGGVEAETRRACENIRGVLAAAGLTMNDIVKTQIFLVDFADFPKVNPIYGSYFSDAPPARSTVAVASLPKNARIEIDCIAVRPGA
jgi:2-iminobutanoate/2-iminopropanoate deaminase